MDITVPDPLSLRILSDFNKMERKPRLPSEIELRFPVEIVQIIYSFVPKLPKPIATFSEQAKRDLVQIQNSPKLKGHSEMFMYGLEEYIV